MATRHFHTQRVCMYDSYTRSMTVGYCLNPFWHTGPHVGLKNTPVKILAGNGFPKSPQAYCITQGTCGVHVGELTGLLWGVNVGVNVPTYCEMTYSHLRQRACPDRPRPSPAPRGCLGSPWVLLSIL